MLPKQQPFFKLDESEHSILVNQDVTAFKQTGHWNQVVEDGGVEESK